jgi:hypothetical protein
MYSHVVMESTTQRFANCEHETEGQRDCAILTNLSFVPGINKMLCVFHKREHQTATGERPKLVQGENVCPHCGDTFEIRSAPGRRARSRARSLATSAFDRHIATCQTRQAILKTQSTTNQE